MTQWLRPVGVAVSALGVSVLVGWIGADFGLRETATDVRELLQSLLVSGGLALGIALAILHLGMPLLRRVVHKVALGYLIGSVAAIITTVATANLILTAHQTLALVVLYMVCFLIISLGLAIIVGLGITQPLHTLTEAVDKLAAGDLGVRVEVASHDEVARLAGAFNRMSSDLAQAFQRLEEMDQARTHLVAAIAHDLRTPLTSARLTVESVRQGLINGSEAITIELERVEDEIDRVSRLTDSLLNLSELEAGTGLHLVPVDLSELVHQTVDQLRPQADEENLKMHVTVGAVADDVVLDPLQVQRLITNLVLNAIQHTPVGEIGVMAQATGHDVIIEVTDTGAGIPPQDLPHIFEHFYRGNAARQQRGDGNGLGLAIARAIAEAHRGTIRVESELGQGARFIVTLPMRRRGEG